MNDKNKPTEPAETAGDVIELKKTIGAEATQRTAKNLLKNTEI